MTSVPWPTPRPEPITFLSPTRAGDLRTCPRRVAYIRDPAFRTLRRISEHALAGLVAHAVYERVATRDYTYPVDKDLAAVLDQLWSQETLLVFERFAHSWAPATVPDPEQWPHMARTRRAILRTQSDRLIPGTTPPTRNGGESKGSAPTKSNSAGPLGPLPWIEQRLTDDVVGVEGTPDRVERGEGGVWVLDLKTGWEQDDATEHQRQQLLVYLHLVAKTLGEIPAGAAIDARRGRFPIESSATEIDAAVTEVAHLRADFNQTLNAGAVPPAYPSPEACRWCRYRLVCQPSAETITEDDCLPLISVGTVTHVDTVNDRTLIDLDVLFPSWRIGASARVIDVAWASPPGKGDVVALSGVHSSSDGRTLTGSWNTITFIFSRSGSTS
jgi:RecB family exonuclease